MEKESLKRQSKYILPRSLLYFFVGNDSLFDVEVISKGGRIRANKKEREKVGSK
jgi:hypothetical protein